MAIDTVTLVTKEAFDALKTTVDNLSANSNWGRRTFNGTGAQTAFVIPHLLDEVVPSSVQVTPGSADAARLFYVTADDENITVTFTSAPPSGTNNVVLNWLVRV